MMQRRLLIDAPNVMARSFHALPPMTHQGRRTEAIYGTLKSVLAARELLGTTGCAFCFDHKECLRKKEYPPYKVNRTDEPSRTQPPEKNKKFLRYQLVELKDRLLPSMSFKNVFCVEGYEADDLLAGVAFRCKEAVIVSSDKDLYQCLRPGVTVYDPGRKYEWTHEAFYKSYGIMPSQWAKVKALSGCPSDNIKGIDGVGDQTAISYVLGTLPAKSVKLQRIRDNAAVVSRNLNLVELPYDGLQVPDLEEDEDTDETWREAFEVMGFKSLRV